jgi:hypothetical protein
VGENNVLPYMSCSRSIALISTENWFWFSFFALLFNFSIVPLTTTPNLNLQNTMSHTTSALPTPTVPYNECTLQLCPIVDAQLPYAPNLAGNALYLAIFSLCLALNLLFGLWYRTWGYLVGMTIGCVLEILGYVGRIQMHFNPFPQNPFFL